MLCPRCHQSIEAQAVACPNCRTPLKAYGHPGIPLYRAGKDEFLCDSCIYHDDDTCTFPQRPYAKTCTLYHDRSMPLEMPVNRYAGNRHGSVTAWLQRNSAWLLLLGLGIVSLALALARR